MQPLVNKFSVSNKKGTSKITNAVLPTDSSLLQNDKLKNETKLSYISDNTLNDSPVFVTDYERLLYELAEERRKEREIEEAAKRLFSVEEGEAWGDIEAIMRGYGEDTNVKYIKDADVEKIEADIREVYKEVSELPENTVVNQKGKNGYMDKVLPSGKTVRHLAKTMAKEGIDSGVATGLVYAANGDDFVDGFVNGTVSGVLSSGVSGITDGYGLLVAGEILGESIEYLMHAYTNESDETNEELATGLAKNAVYALIRCVPKSGIHAIIYEADKENSIARQCMEYDDGFGGNLELFWSQIIDVLTSLEEDESGE